MKNRYENLLRTHNKQIIERSVYSPYLFYIGAFELQKVWNKGARVLEIGCGEGDSALPMLERTPTSLGLLDLSKEMIAACKKKLQKYAKRTRYIQADALRYLKNAEPYDVTYSAWTVHNFTQADKKKLFAAIYNNLKWGGTFILLDKVYPGVGTKSLLERQLSRYQHLPPLVVRAISRHEAIDASNLYRMDEKPLIRSLKAAGFGNIRVIDRIERYIVLTARK